MINYNGLTGHQPPDAVKDAPLESDNHETRHRHHKIKKQEATVLGTANSSGLSVTSQPSQTTLTSHSTNISRLPDRSISPDSNTVRPKIRPEYAPYSQIQKYDPLHCNTEPSTGLYKTTYANLLPGKHLTIKIGNQELIAIDDSYTIPEDELRSLEVSEDMLFILEFLKQNPHIRYIVDIGCGDAQTSIAMNIFLKKAGLNIKIFPTDIANYYEDKNEKPATINMIPAQEIFPADPETTIFTAIHPYTDWLTKQKNFHIQTLIKNNPNCFVITTEQNGKCSNPQLYIDPDFVYTKKYWISETDIIEGTLTPEQEKSIQEYKDYADKLNKHLNHYLTNQTGDYKEHVKNQKKMCCDISDQIMTEYYKELEKASETCPDLDTDKFDRNFNHKYFEMLIKISQLRNADNLIDKFITDTCESKPPLISELKNKKNEDKNIPYGTRVHCWHVYRQTTEPGT